jgi:DNA helicase-2/ATP-dependent DNA helicase PcrA
MITGLQDKLNPEQYDAVVTINGPLLIIAGAGSGKTRVITHRIAWMLSEGVHQNQILALTFTNKAAKEMQERVVQLTRKPLKQLTVSTFHAFGVQILNKHAHRLGYRNGFTIYDSSDQQSLIRESARALSMATDDMDFNQVVNVFSRIKTRRVKWRDLDDRHLEPLYQEYQSHLKLYNALDFDDLIALPIFLFENFPDVLTEYRAQYRYIMVDEFQDTSLNQYEFMRFLALGSRNICVVGDDDQSIYSWRGANFENIRLFEKDFSELKEIKLEQNYRSTGSILEAANSLIANNKHRKEKALWTHSGDGKPIELYQLGSESDEAEFIAETIKATCLRENLSYDDIGLLIRTNAIARNIEEVFLEKNLPYRMSGGTSFFQRPEIKDMISYLRVLTNPDDDVSLLRILNTPRRGIGKKSLQTLTGLSIKHRCSLYGAMLLLQEMGEAAALRNGDKLQAGFDFGPMDDWASSSGDDPEEEAVSKWDDDLDPSLGPAETTRSQPSSRMPDLLAKIPGARGPAGRPAPSVPITKPKPKPASVAPNEAGMTKLAFHSIMEFLELVDRYRPLFLKKNRQLAATLRQFIHELDYWAYLLQEFQKNEKVATWRFRNLEIFCASLERFEKDPDNLEPSIFTYLNRITLDSRDDQDEEGIKGKVNLMTIHASKGLEFPVVFLAGVEDGIVPHKRSLLENEEGDYEANMEEERRLFYVAITRAQSKLYITACRTRMVSRQSVESSLSPFLQEIPAHLIAFKEPQHEVPDDSTGQDLFAKLKLKLGGEAGLAVDGKDLRNH